jgi:hypothetical protein
MFIHSFTFDLASILHIKVTDEKGSKVVMVSHVELPSVGQLLTLKVPAYAKP